MMRRRDFIGAAAGGLTLAALRQPMAASAKPFQSLSYHPSGIEHEGELARGIAETRIRLDITRIAKVTAMIRTYGVDRGLDRVLPAATANGLMVSLGLRLGRDKAQNDLEIARGLKLLVPFGKIVRRVYVGSETLRRRELSAAELADYVRRVRVFIADPAVSVGTGEGWQDWLKHRALADACDFIGVHLAPYRDGIRVSAAVDEVALRHQELRAAFGKPVAIAEVGWPSAGPPVREATPSPEAQEAFARAFLARAAREGYDYNFAEAFDQPWKARLAGGAADAHFGLFDGRRAPKMSLVGG